MSYKDVNISNPYVYLKDIQDIYPGIYNKAQNIINQQTIENKEISESISNALIFLEGVTRLQRQHEEKFLEHKINEINATFDDKNETQKRLISEFEKFKKTGDYSNLIRAFNYAEQSATSFVQRLKTLKSEDKPDYERESLLKVSNIKTLLETVFNKRQEILNDRNEIIFQLVTKLLIANKDKIITNNADDIAATAIIIQDLVVNFLRDSTNFYKEFTDYDLKKAEVLKEFNDLFDKLNKFIQQEDTEQVFNNNGLIQEAKRIFGINSSSFNSRKISRENKAKISKKKGAGESYKNALVSWFGKTYTNPFNTQQLKQYLPITVTWNGIHHVSEIEEIRLLLSEQAIQLGQLNSATDTLGYYEISFSDPEKEKSKIKEGFAVLEDIRNTIKQENAANNPEKISQVYEQKLAEISDRLSEQGKKGFIIHDTVKFYSTVEKQKGGLTKFSGRNMNIFNYIDSIAQMGLDNGISIDWLKFVAYNLAENAVGAAKKAPLETYFSIFAGLIMFDDFAIIAKEITKNLEFSNVDSIHLYQIQSIYFPASYILQQTYSWLKNISEEYKPASEIRTAITAPEIKMIYKEKTKKRDKDGKPLMRIRMLGNWEDTKEYAETHNKITLYFLQDFLSLVSTLLVGP